MTDESKNFENFLKQTESANVVPVVETLSADLLTPLAVYLKISQGAIDSFLLESVEGGESLGRYSFIGANPEMIVGGSDTQTFVHKINGTKTYGTSLFDFLRNYFADIRIDGAPDLPAFVGGAIGFFGFSCAGWFEKSLKLNQPENEDAKLMFFRHVVAFDHAKQVIQIIALVFTDEADSHAELKNLYENAVANNEKLKEILEKNQ
jgi:anthranilate synthase component 1